MKLASSGLFGDEYVGFVSLVDLKFVSQAADKWNAPLALTPGAHMLGVECRFSNFVARANLSVELLGDRNYQLMIQVDRAEGSDGRRFADFWIKEVSTGVAVTSVHRRQFTGGRIGSSFRVSS